LAIADGDLVQVSTPQGNSLFRAALTDRQRRGEIFTPIHWTDCQSSAGRTALLTAPLTDPHSGQPGFKSTPARAEKVEVDWQAFLIARTMPRRIGALYHTRIRLAGGWLVELAGIGDSAAMAERLLPKGERLEAFDAARGARYAVLADGRLEAAMLISTGGKLPSRDWLVAQLSSAETASRTELLAGRPAKPGCDQGKLVCACFDVGARTLLRAISQQELVSVEQVGQALRAGTNCGSCRPAIRSFLAAEKADAGRRSQASPGDRL
jgi:assimilatory nitrate reductase catalytic subunit